MKAPWRSARSALGMPRYPHGGFRKMRASVSSGQPSGR